VAALEVELTLALKVEVEVVKEGGRDEKGGDDDALKGGRRMEDVDGNNARR